MQKKQKKNKYVADLKRNICNKNNLAKKCSVFSMHVLKALP